VKPIYLRVDSLYRSLEFDLGTGICVITLNTHPSAAPFGLIPNHSYAILGVLAQQGRHAVGILESEYANEMQRGNPSTDRDFTLLELDWEDVCDQFSSICINWDPSIFAYRDVVHGTWESSGKVANHQFRIRSNASAVVSRNSNSTIWCLLTRHTRTIHDKEDLIALHSFISNGREQVAQSQALKEAYSDSPQCMTILDHDTGCEAVTLVASHHAPGGRQCGYTLQIFSSDPVELYDAKPSLPYRKELFGSLSSRNSGGNALFPTFFMNPQYSFVIHPSRESSGPVERSDARFFLHGDRNIPLNIKVIWSSGPRITDVSQGDIAIDSGAYNYGYVYATGSLRPGQYTAVVSSFEPRMTTEYSLVLESSAGFDISPIPSEGADMFAKTVKGIWESGRNVIYELITPRQTEIQIRLQFADPGIRIPLKLSVYPESRTPASQASPFFSAQSSGAISGVLTERSMCSAGKFLIVPSAQRASIGKRFLLFVYSSACPVSVTQKFIDG